MMLTMTMKKKATFVPALLFLSSLVLDSASANSWPVARFKNGTVGLQNEGATVLINAQELQVVGDVVAKGRNLIPPKCMSPGGDRLQYNGTDWLCVCAESWAGETCETQLPGASPLAAGVHHVCAILDDKSVKCWGWNKYGQLGLGDTDDRGDASGEMGDNLPTVDLGTGRTAIAISTGNSFSCAILDDKSVKCWGYNGFGRLGQGDLNTRGDASGEMGDNLLAIDLGTGRTAIAITTGGAHGCAILDDKSVKCWGWNNNGQLGLGDTDDRGDASGEMGDNLPTVDLGTGRTAIAISADDAHTCALLDNKSVKCWGYNFRGQLGLGDRDNRGDASGEMGDNLPTVDLGTGRTAIAIASGGLHTCALLDNLSVKCWGYNNRGQLGLGDTNQRGDASDEMGDNLPTVDLGTGRTAIAISAGGYHTCALLDNKSVKCWGINDNGRLGQGDTNHRGDASGEMGDNLPTVDLGTGRTATSIIAGNGHSCAVLDNKSVKCWGYNGDGRLGLGDTDDRGDASGEMGDNLPAVDLGETSV